MHSVHLWSCIEFYLSFMQLGPTYNDQGDSNLVRQPNVGVGWVCGCRNLLTTKTGFCYSGMVLGSVARCKVWLGLVVFFSISILVGYLMPDPLHTHTHIYTIYIYIYIYIYICVCVCVCVYIYSVCKYIYMYMCVCVYISIYVYEYIYIYIYIYMCVCVCVCV